MLLALTTLVEKLAKVVSAASAMMMPMQMWMVQRKLNQNQNEQQHHGRT